MTVLTLLLTFLLGAEAKNASDLSGRLDAIVSGTFAESEPGAAVLVTRSDEVLLRKGYGMADLELGVPLAPDMVFRVGSVTKQFTAAAILLLEERGLLSVTDDILKHLPDFPTGGRTITIENLLTHTSGIRNYTDLGAFRQHARDDLSLDEIIALFEKEPFDFEPGEKWAYSNSGYVLLGAIIEKVSGESYASFVENNIFRPLGMSHTYYGAASPIIARRARGYRKTEHGFQNAEYLSMRVPHAAGALLSTVDDLSRWNQALYTTELLSETSLAKWWRSFRLRNGVETHYGYGWSLGAYDGHPFVAHGGSIHGFTCYVLRMPEDRVFVAVLTNRNARRPAPGLLARKLAATAIGKPLEEPEPASLPEATLARYEGVYRVDEDAYYLVKLASGQLTLHRFGDVPANGGTVRNPGPDGRLNRMRVGLLPASESTFFVKDSTLNVTFERGTLVVENWGHTEHARRTDAPIDDQPRVLATVEQLFDAMASQDRDALGRALDPEARLVRTSSRDGEPATGSLSGADFIRRIAAHEGPPLVETIWDPEVRIEDNLATVWVSYNFFLGDRLDHCGEDTFQLARTALFGWRIVAIADTSRRDGCAANRGSGEDEALKR